MTSSRMWAPFARRHCIVRRMSATAKTAVHLSLHIFLIAGILSFSPIANHLQNHIFCRYLRMYTTAAKRSHGDCGGAHELRDDATKVLGATLPLSPPSWGFRSRRTPPRAGDASLGSSSRRFWTTPGGYRTPTPNGVLCCFYRIYRELPRGLSSRRTIVVSRARGRAFNGVSPEARRLAGPWRGISHLSGSLLCTHALHAIQPSTLPRVVPSQGPIALPSPWTRTHTDAIIIRGWSYTGTR